MKNFDRIINNCADLETIEIMSEEDIYLKGCMELWLKTLKNVIVHSETPPVYLGSGISLCLRLPRDHDPTRALRQRTVLQGKPPVDAAYLQEDLLHRAPLGASGRDGRERCAGRR